MNSYIYEDQNSKSFYNMAWIAFIISFAGMAIGIWHLEGDLAIKGFLVMSSAISTVAQKGFRFTQFGQKIELQSVCKFD